MRRLLHDGVEIAFFDKGEGEPIVLVHGFADTAVANWVHSGWVDTLTKAGRRVIALDNNYQNPDPELVLDVVPNTARVCKIRHVLSNSFGFGGQNVCLLLSRGDEG